ncbi:hypothetical protein ACS5PN_07255 [Roseateles sp. NT4]|uniref:hypothetical protein n=1 Tax=Roseateles sp. NT4 TaxID=3453715 RepID=UPI003EE9EA5D
MRERSALGEGDVAAMADLFERYYEGGPPSQFKQDLAGKTHVIELRDGDTLCGFSTLCVYDFDATQGAVRVIFSGDTIIDQAYWGEQSLALAFCRFAGATKAADPQRPLYWLLISKGHRTYRYLNLFAHRYNPSHAADGTPSLAGLMAEIASQRFGDAFDARTGLVHFGAAATRLRPRWQDEDSTKRLSPATRYFLQRNPGHAQGDELVCLCELDAPNLRSFALKAFREGLVHG